MLTQSKTGSSFTSELKKWSSIPKITKTSFEFAQSVLSNYRKMSLSIGSNPVISKIKAIPIMYGVFWERIIKKILETSCYDSIGEVPPFFGAISYIVCGNIKTWSTGIFMVHLDFLCLLRWDEKAPWRPSSEAALLRYRVINLKMSGNISWKIITFKSENKKVAPTQI